MTVGIELSALDAELRRVPAHLMTVPARSFDGMDRVGPSVRTYIAARFNAKWIAERSFTEISRHLPLKAFTRFTLDEIAKLRYSSIIMMDETVEDEFRKNPRYAIVNKIVNSMWRWGFGRGNWNQVVDAYEGIRNFSLGDDFEVRLDYTRGHNECGTSEHSETFLDGVFAFLVHYRDEHIMTIGFSIALDRRLLIQQVQLKNRRGNRWLFKIPRNRLEFVIDRFSAAFPRHKLLLVDGHDVVIKSLKSYHNGLSSAQERLDRAPAGDVTYYVEQATYFSERIAHLEVDLGRLESFYHNTGHYTLDDTIFEAHGLKHYGLVLAN